MVSLSLHCPNCLEEMEVLASHAGLPVRCQECQTLVLLPLDLTTAEPEDAAWQPATPVADCHAP